METRLGGLGRHLALGLTGALTTWLAVWAWRGFLEEPGTYLRPLLVLALLVGTTGALGRWARLPAALVVGGQVAASLLVGAVLLTGSVLPAEGAPGPLDQLRAAADTAQAYAAPVPAEAPGLHPLLIAGGLGLMLLVDVLAGTLRRASLAGLPLLMAIALPVSMLGGGVSPVVFALTAAGFLALLVLQEDDEVDRWGSSLADDHRSSVLGRPGAARAGAAGIGVVVTALALAVPTGVPSLGLTLLDGPFGAGADDDIKLDNPMVDLRRDLKRGEDVPLVTARTDAPDPRYLRITVLSRFTLDAWSNGDRDLPDDQRADGEVPGVDEVDPRLRGESHAWELTTRQSFQSAWLPTPYPMSSVQAPGNWKYDLSTMDFLAASDDLDAADLGYTATGTEVDVSAGQLAAASPGTAFVDPEYTALPDDLPSLVGDLARGVTADQGTDFEKARALQQWFRSDGGFEYTLERDDGNGGDALEEFLVEGPEGRRGYCEQFASAMAVMARSLGIPARVAIGFLQPEQLAPGVYEYSAHDLHSWPELYFQGAGWVRFEPTPAGRAPAVPSYTRGSVDLSAEPDGVEGGVGDEALPDRGADGANQGGAADEAEADAGAADEGGGFPWGLLAAGLAVLLLAGLAVLPRRLRRRRSERRWRTAPPAVAAWAEVRDASVDLRLAWPAGRSPRDTGEALLPSLAEGPVAAEAALERLVRAIEQEWYAPSSPDRDATALRADAELCVLAMSVGVSPRRRFRARWLPASLGHRDAPGFAERSLADADRVS